MFAKELEMASAAACIVYRETRPDWYLPDTLHDRNVARLNGLPSQLHASAIDGLPRLCATAGLAPVLIHRAPH